MFMHLKLAILLRNVATMMRNLSKKLYTIQERRKTALRTLLVEKSDA